METRKLGSQGLAVPAIGLGCMGMSDFYSGNDPSSERESIATIQEALDRGVTLLDTGDFYGMGNNELLIREAIRGRRDQAVLSVKFGALRNHDGAFIGYDARPEFVKTSLAYSLRRLNVDYIDFYFPARVDPKTPIEDTVGAIGDLIREGKVRYAGLSEASGATVRKAHAAHPISALETEYSLWTRDIEDETLPILRELGIGVLAYGALSRGLLTGNIADSNQLGPRDFRSHIPRFQGNNLAANLKLVDRLKQIAAEKNITPSQLAIAWVLAQGLDIVPVVGAKRRKHLQENLASADVQLSRDDLRRIEDAIPRGAVSGDRYPAAAMAALNQ
jgi:aryl-alcohol dehydrogenase-like predicted oxidoreductase